MKKKKIKTAARQSVRLARKRKAKARATAVRLYQNSWRFKHILKKQKQVSSVHFDRARETMLAEMAMRGNHNAMDRLMEEWERPKERTLCDQDGNVLAKVVTLEADEYFDANGFDFALTSVGLDPKDIFDPTPVSPRRGQQ